MKRSKRLSFFFLCFLLSVLLLSSCGGDAPETTDADDTGHGTNESGGETGEEAKIPMEKLVIHSISELNLTGATDDHASQIGSAVFELNYREWTTVSRKYLKTTDPYYPRLKKIADDNYLLFYNNGKTGPSCYLSHSRDLLTWDEAVPLFEETSDTQYATCDALLLKNGDILAVASFRPKDWGSYTGDMTKSGLVLRRSTDGGKTWSEMQKIYTGMNWEPSLLQLDGGEIHCYFTHTAPYTYLYGYNNTIRSSGSALIRSKDNGKTWTPFVTEAPYAADRVTQTYIGDMNGRKMFNDQMPVATLLHNGHILLATETLNLKNVLRISVSHSADNWATPLGIEEAGPKDKSVLAAAHGSGPYTAQMLSGETAVCFFGDGAFKLVTGDSDGRNFSADTKPLEEHNTCYWPSLEVVGSHALLAACCDDTQEKNVKFRRLTLGTMVLNHDLYAKKMTPVIDGNGDDWGENTDALFIGSTSQAQASVRFAEDDENLYILIERLDRFLDGKEDTTSVLFSDKAGEIYYRVTVGVNGITKVQRFENQKASNYSSGIDGKVTVDGTVDKNDDEDVGYVAELRLPKKDFPVSLSDGMFATALLSNKDDRQTYDQDSVTGHDLTDRSGWTFVTVK